MEIIKDYLSVIIAAGSVLASIAGAAGIYWKIFFKLKAIEKRLEALEKKYGCGDEKIIALRRKSDRQIEILHRNVIRIMEEMKLEPVKDLFKETP